MIDKIEKIKTIARNFNRNTIHPPPPLNPSTIGDSRKRNAYDIFLKNVVQELKRQNVTDKIIIRKVIEILWRNSSTNERMAYRILARNINLLLSHDKSIAGENWIQEPIHISIKHLYEEFKTPVEERIQLCDDNLDESCLEKLNLEFERLREIMRTIIHKALKVLLSLSLFIIYSQLVDLWDDVWFLIVNAMDFSKAYKKIINFYLQFESAEKIYELLPQEVSRLQELYACQLRK
ncbi:hypothetical protein Glove_60g92 [Diversispora epigaea]|uniref:HMG box domain-containing protein n=1 Tax=Diversispora epigaea TaxID=1348612 RepID=A0A397JIG4_9GLOM|nr:hypothetical protein Glove_60g92 [Diversispora epigaea]